MYYGQIFMNIVLCFHMFKYFEVLLTVESMWKHRVPIGGNLQLKTTSDWSFQILS